VISYLWFLAGMGAGLFMASLFDGPVFWPGLVGASVLALLAIVGTLDVRGKS
jgi:hypothetical protein